MKNKSFSGIILSALIFSLAIISCNSGGTSKVTITIDLGLHNKAAFNAPENSIIDRVLRFFAKDAEAAPPSNISSITLNITGAGMDKITQSYPATQSIITIEVPAGDSRTFEILAYTPSVTFRGAATRNLSSGATVNIPITMGLYETKIVIPDFNNNRIVQIDNMTGTNWQEVAITNPYDVDFDSSGRIYISTNNRIYRMNDINDTAIDFKFFDAANYRAIAADRKNNLLYYFRYSTLSLYRDTLDIIEPTIQTPYILPGITFLDVRGLSVDDNGYLYIAGTTGDGERVIKYNPTTTVVTQYSTDLIIPWDVAVKNGYLYIADYDNSSPYTSGKVVQLSLDLNYIDQLGGTNTGTFYGPHRFLAILNRKTYLADNDEASSATTYARITAFDNINGDNFDTYGQHGYTVQGEGFFRLWCNC